MGVPDLVLIVLEVHIDGRQMWHQICIVNHPITIRDLSTEVFSIEPIPHPWLSEGIHLDGDIECVLDIQSGNGCQGSSQTVPSDIDTCPSIFGEEQLDLGFHGVGDGQVT